MITSLQGKLAAKLADSVVLELGGLGLKVFVAAKTMNNLPALGQEVKLYTVLQVSERQMELYGFENQQAQQVFELADKVSGIGPKAALKISALGTLTELEQAVNIGDTSFFESKFHYHRNRRRYKMARRPRRE